MRMFCVAGLAAIVLAACEPAPEPEAEDAPMPATAFSAGRWIDLTHDVADDAVFWPTAEEFRLEIVADGESEGGYHYSAFNIVTSEHGGTHLDAPYHFAENGMTTEEIPLDRLIGPAAVIDVSDAASADRDYLVTVADVAEWEAEHGELPDGAILILRTGFAKYWPDKESYLGTAERGADAVPKLHFPGLSPDLAEFLTSERSITAVGLDTASIDHGQSSEFMAHRILGSANVLGFENLANLDALPASGATIIALPMKIRGGSGGPLRIIAHVPVA